MINKIIIYFLFKFNFCGYYFIRYILKLYNNFIYPINLNLCLNCHHFIFIDYFYHQFNHLHPQTLHLHSPPPPPLLNFYNYSNFNYQYYSIILYHYLYHYFLIWKTTHFQIVQSRHHRHNFSPLDLILITKTIIINSNFNLLIFLIIIGYISLHPY